MTLAEILEPNRFLNESVIMRLIVSVLILMASMFALIGAVVYPARTNGNNTFYGTNNHIGPVIVGSTNFMSNYGSHINKVFFTNGNAHVNGILYVDAIYGTDPVPPTLSFYAQATFLTSGDYASSIFLGSVPGEVSINGHINDSGYITTDGSVTATNFIHSKWKWIDILTSGDAIASNPTGDPPVLTQYGTSNYFGYAYFYNDAADGDKSYFTLQSAHKIAATNAANPNVWVEPHIHVTTTNFTAGTNATFRLDLYYGNVWGYLTNWYAKTNTVSMTNTYQHCVLSFGNLTNNAIFSGRSSVLFKGRIMRIDGGTGDIGANPVWVDSVDIHIPVTELGSTGQTGD